MNLKLSLKITGILILFSLGLFIFISFDDIYSRKSNIMPLFIQRAKAIAYSMEASIRNEEELKDKERLLSLIQKNMWLDSDIINIDINIIQGGELTTYISDTPEKMSRSADADNINSFNNDIFISQDKINNTTEVVKVVAPIHISGKIVGTVQIDLDFALTNKMINETIKEEVLGYGAIFTVFIIIMFFIFRLIVINPIKAVDSGVDAVRKSNFDYKIKVTAKDEIGHLAQAFNEMAQDLKKSRAELEDYNKKLAKQVDEQTKDLGQAKKQLETINLDLEEKVKVRTAELEKLKKNQENLIVQRTTELDQRVAELERLNKFMINRENKMIELKKEIENLKNDQPAV